MRKASIFVGVILASGAAALPAASEPPPGPAPAPTLAATALEVPSLALNEKLKQLRAEREAMLDQPVRVSARQMANGNVLLGAKFATFVDPVVDTIAFVTTGARTDGALLVFTMVPGRRYLLDCGFAKVPTGTPTPVALARVTGSLPPGMVSAAYDWPATAIGEFRPTQGAIGHVVHTLSPVTATTQVVFRLTGDAWHLRWCEITSARGGG